MYDCLSVAKTLYNLYYERYGSELDEMKMHKLMYFSERESLLRSGDVLFKEPFYGWKYGPVLLSVRHEYRNPDKFSGVSAENDPDVVTLLNQVLDRYGDMSAWKLSDLSHAEYSWKRSRKGLGSNDNGNVALEVSAMKVDAASELARRRMESGN